MKNTVFINLCFFILICSCQNTSQKQNTKDIENCTYKIPPSMFTVNVYGIQTFKNDGGMSLKIDNLGDLKIKNRTYEITEQKFDSTGSGFIEVISFGRIKVAPGAAGNKIELWLTDIQKTIFDSLPMD